MSTIRVKYPASPRNAIEAMILATILLSPHLITAGAQPPAVAERGAHQSSGKNNPQKPADDALSLHSDLVVVNITVIDAAGQYAHGLTARDFVVGEDNTMQKLDSFAAEEAPFAAAVLIDMSGSMEYKFGLVRAAAATFVDHIRDNDQVAVYGFNNTVRRFQDFTNVRDISEYIWDATARDNTRMYDCMDEAIDALAKRQEKRRAMLLISDGCDTTSSKASENSVIKKALSAGVTIYSVDLIEDSALMGGGSAATGLQRGRGEMKQFSSETGGRYVHSPQGDKLEEAFTNIVDELRNQYTLTYYSSNPKRDGRWRRLTVKVSRPGLSARTRKGYWAAKS
jgi:Ca-activated chloride channel family protein